MYPKFIEVHLADDDCVVTLNIDHIIGISNTDNNGAGYAIKTSDRGGWYVRESYNELKALIIDAGCLIHKADPRLDMTHPLTLDDLKDMVGEPVWNSNLDRWELVTMVTDFFCKTCHTGQYAGEYSEDDLIKTPLYRMRQ